MATPVKKKFKHYRGDDFRYVFRIEEYIDPDDPDAGTVPRDLTGWTAVPEADPDVTVTLTPNPLNSTGQIHVDIPAEDLGDDQVDIVYFDVQLIDTTGFRRTYLRAQMNLVAQVQ